jgi:dienelactone hydrolase
VAPLDTYAVAETRHTWVDTTRPTAAHVGQPELPERTLDVVVYAPEDEPGPWPLLVFGHGSSRAGDHYEGTLSAWASAGYVVVAPDYPLTSEGTPGGSKLDDVEAQAGDVSFLIDTALAELDAVDPERIGIGGQSLGAITALGAGFNACCADPRIDVVTEFAGIWFPLSGEVQDPATTDRPLLMVHGGADHSLTSIDQAVGAWEDVIDAPGGFITLTGAEHDDGYYEGPVDARGTVVTEAALAFYDAHLKDDPDGWDRVRAAVEEAGPDVATLQEREG